jgi:hypothetical protein
MSVVGGRRPPLQVLKHYVNIDQSVLRMTEGARQSPNNFHPEILPKSHRRFVCRDNEIKLHSAKAEASSFGQTMLAHCATNPPPARFLRDNKRGVGNVRSVTGLIGMHCVTAQDLAVVLGNQDVSIALKPICQPILAGNIWIERVGLAGNDYFLKNVPDRVVV